MSDLRTTEPGKEELDEEGHPLGTRRYPEMVLVRAKKAAEEAAVLGAAKYVECSALKNIGVKQVFQEAVKAAMAGRLEAKQKRKKCLLL